MNRHLKLGQVIRAERKTQKLTQEELGKFSGTGINFISELERGKSTVRFDKLLAVLETLGLELQLQRGKEGIRLAKELSI